MTNLEKELDLAERKAWDALSRYKFWMFGYYAAQWVNLNRIGEFKRPNPWHCIVVHAKELKPRKALTNGKTDSPSVTDSSVTPPPQSSHDVNLNLPPFAHEKDRSQQGGSSC